MPQQEFCLGLRVPRPALLDPLVDELGCDRSEGVVGGDTVLKLLAHLLYAGVFSSSDLSPRLVPALARIAQADLGIGAQTELLFLALDPVFQPPELSAARLDNKKSPPESPIL